MVFYKVKTRRKSRTIIDGFLLGCLSVFAACATTPPAAPYHIRIYKGNYESVWGATMKAIRDYPLKFTNKDTGRIQTEVVNSPYNDLVFTYPEPIELSERFRYFLRLDIAKISGNTDSDTSVRVRITKELERFVDFYTGWVPFSADGLEEKVILYRVAHILEMDKRMVHPSSE